MSIIYTHIKIIWLSFSLFIALFSLPVLSEVISMQGRVLDDASRPIKGVVIEVPGIGQANTKTKANISSITTDVDGRFTIKVPESLFQLTLDGHGFYSSVHTFSQSELQQNSDTIPAIKLTAKRAGRVMLAFGGDA